MQIIIIQHKHGANTHDLITDGEYIFRFFKFVEVQSHRLHDNCDHHKDDMRIWNSIDWDNRRQHRNSLRRFLSNEKLTDNRKHHRHHHHHRRHMLLFSGEYGQGLEPYTETVIPQPHASTGSVRRRRSWLRQRSWRERVSGGRGSRRRNHYSYPGLKSLSLPITTITTARV